LLAQEAALVVENAQLLDEQRLLNTDMREMVDAQAHLLETIEEMIGALDSEDGDGILRHLAGQEYSCV
jgi:hypothetical protein